MENFSRTSEYLERLRKVSMNSDVWFANPLDGSNDLLENLKKTPQENIDYTSYRSSLLSNWQEEQKNKEEYDSRQMPSFNSSEYSEPFVSSFSASKVVLPEPVAEKVPVIHYEAIPAQPSCEIQPNEQSRTIEQSRVMEQSRTTEPSKESLPIQDSARHNPFVQLTQKKQTPQVSPKTENSFQNIDGWFTSGRCFGILGVVVGSLLTAFSLLSSTGSHTMSALGLSMFSAGIFMFATVGLLTAFQNIKGRV